MSRIRAQILRFLASNTGMRISRTIFPSFPDLHLRVHRDSPRLFLLFRLCLGLLRKRTVFQASWNFRKISQQNSPQLSRGIHSAKATAEHVRAKNRTRSLRRKAKFSRFAFSDRSTDELCPIRLRFCARRKRRICPSLQR